ncbi:hypothetical protein KSS87_014814 [Heliosperma pusillum]|nr:hypothetical protein KSS87_014814 [Heliosperma pusillum]
MALLSKAQEEADPFGAMPKKDAESQQGSFRTESVKNTVDCTSLIASVSNNVEQCASSSVKQGTEDVPDKSKEDEDDASDKEEPGEEDEDESDLDLAWKMLDLARAILEKQSEETVDMVDFLSVSFRRSLARKRTVRRKAADPFTHVTVSFAGALETLAVEAIPYYQKAVSACKSRMQRLMDETTTKSASMSVSAASETIQDGCHSSVASQADDIVFNAQAEIETLTSLLGPGEEGMFF